MSEKTNALYNYTMYNVFWVNNCIRVIKKVNTLGTADIGKEKREMLKFYIFSVNKKCYYYYI